MQSCDLDVSNDALTRHQTLPPAFSERSREILCCGARNVCGTDGRSPLIIEDRQDRMETPLSLGFGPLFLFQEGSLGLDHQGVTERLLPDRCDGDRTAKNIRMTSIQTLNAV